MKEKKDFFERFIYDGFCHYLGVFLRKKGKDGRIMPAAVCVIFFFEWVGPRRYNKYNA